jgi:hypothetical protein
MSSAATGGLIGGIVGGIAVSLVMLAGALGQKHDVWQPLKGASVPFLGDRAMAPGFDMTAVVVGVLSHFAVSIVWGILFGLLFYGLSKGATILAGAVWGIVVWLGMYYVLLPLIGLGKMAAGAPLGFAIIGHVIFGLAVAIGFLPWQREARTPAGMPPMGPTLGRPLR